MMVRVSMMEARAMQVRSLPGFCQLEQRGDKVVLILVQGGGSGLLSNGETLQWSIIETGSFGVSIDTSAGRACTHTIACCLDGARSALALPEADAESRMDHHGGVRGGRRRRAEAVYWVGSLAIRSPRLAKL